ncbi:helix-turn-helix domain-containing protein [Bacteroides reticulotermitis]|uniref:helix-turn-helix domain-containing protein n=1 Tax=Bacteroides reticulotermitis TaxID=1133319 RepID=UPI0004B4C907|nr:helix-turn-helix domain-containing protein [Bacteroides reticulotermitis]
MSNKTIEMSKIRQVLRCYASGYGTKSLSDMLGLYRNTIEKYLHLYQKSGLSMEEILRMMIPVCILFFKRKPNPKKLSVPVARPSKPFCPNTPNA